MRPVLPASSSRTPAGPGHRPAHDTFPPKRHHLPSNDLILKARPQNRSEEQAQPPSCDPGWCQRPAGLRGGWSAEVSEARPDARSPRRPLSKAAWGSALTSPPKAGRVSLSQIRGAEAPPRGARVARRLLGAPPAGRGRQRPGPRGGCCSPGPAVPAQGRGRSAHTLCPRPGAHDPTWPAPGSLRRPRLRGPGSGRSGARDAGRGCEQGRGEALAAGRGAPPRSSTKNAGSRSRAGPDGGTALPPRGGEGRGEPRPVPGPRPAPPPRPRSIPPAPGAAPRLLTEGSPPRQRRARPATARLAAAASFLPAARDRRFRVSAPIPLAPPARPPARGPAGRRPGTSRRPRLRPPPPALPLQVLTPLPALPPAPRRPLSISSPDRPRRRLFVSPLPLCSPRSAPANPRGPAFPVPSLRPASRAGTPPLHGSRPRTQTFGFFRAAPHGPAASCSLAGPRAPSPLTFHSSGRQRERLPAAGTVPAGSVGSHRAASGGDPNPWG